jgi:hypothetical protein
MKLFSSGSPYKLETPLSRRTDEKCNSVNYGTPFG